MCCRGSTLRSRSLVVLVMLLGAVVGAAVLGGWALGERPANPQWTLVAQEVGEAPVPAAEPTGGGIPLASPLTGTIVRLCCQVGQAVQSGDVVLILEAMKMETEVRADQSGTIVSIAVQEGDSTQTGDALLHIG